MTDTIRTRNEQKPCKNACGANRYRRWGYCYPCGRARSAAKPCAWKGCDGERFSTSGYCRPHQAIKTKEAIERKRHRINAIKLERGCALCGYNEHAAALDFDHIDGDKQFDISKSPGRAWNRTLAEIDKCQVLCANCHRIATYERHNRQTEAVLI